MLRLTAGHRVSRAPRGGPDPHRIRMPAPRRGMVCALVLALATASAGPGGDAGGAAVRQAVRVLAPVRAYASSSSHPAAVPQDDRKGMPAAPGPGGRVATARSGAEDETGSGTRAADGAGNGYGTGSGGGTGGGGSRWPAGGGAAPVARCGPELASPEGVEAQTCVLTQDADTWARTYYRNTTGRPLDAELSLLGPDGRSVRTRCAVGADDEPDTCETPRERTLGGPDTYTAVGEFAARGEAGPLLLRSGSNSPQQ